MTHKPTRLAFLALFAFLLLAFSVQAQSNFTGNLTINDVDVSLTTLARYEEGSERASHLNVVDGESLDFEDIDAGPGSELRFNIDLENTFSDSSENDMTDVIATVTIEEIDDGDDLEEESESITLNTGDTGTLDLFFNIPLLVIRDTYNVIIEVEGEGDDGKTYSDRMEVSLTIDKQTRDVYIEEASLFPTTIKCSGTARLTATIRNLGTKEENDIVLQATNSELNLNYQKKDIFLDEEPFDEDNVLTVEIPISINSGTRAKSYPIKLDALLQPGMLWDTKTLTLQVQSCPQSQTAQPTQPKPENTTKPAGQQEPQTQPTQTSPKSQNQTQVTEPINTIPVLKPASVEKEDNGFWIIFALGNIALLAIVIIVAIVLLKRN